MSPAAYNAAQAGIAAFRVGHSPPQSRLLAPGQYTAQNARPYMASQSTLEQQELQRLKNLKTAILAANRVMSMTYIHSLSVCLSIFLSFFFFCLPHPPPLFFSGISPAKLHVQLIINDVCQPEKAVHFFLVRKRKSPTPGGRKK